MADAGVDVPALMEKLGNRMKLWHITDRGSRKKGPYITPILKEEEMELGYGNMDLKTLAEIAKKNGVEGVILETHKNSVAVIKLLRSKSLTFGGHLIPLFFSILLGSERLYCV